MKSASRILVILPALNEGRIIAGTVRGIRERLPAADVLVVDDGSRDDTAAEARTAGAQVLQLPYNLGIGAAVQAGFQFARAYDYDIVLRNDGDGQHAPENNLALLARLDLGDVDVVIGSRYLDAHGDYGTPLPRRLGSAILARLLARIIGQRVTDPTSAAPPSIAAPSSSSPPPIPMTIPNRKRSSCCIGRACARWRRPRR